MVQHSLLFNFKRTLAIALILIGLWLFFPIPGPDDIINVMLGTKISSITNLPLTLSIILTYPLGLVIAFMGAWIYPHGTFQILNGIRTRIFNLFRRVLVNPLYAIAGIIVFLLFVYVYFNYF